MKKFYLILATMSLMVCSNSVFSQNDCSTAIFICDSIIGAPAGAGVQELNAGNQGCLTVEHNSTWYSINIAASGTLTMLIEPAGFTDFDFAVWGPGPTCPPSSPPNRCSYAIGGGDNTGISSADNFPETDTSEGSGGNQWVEDLDVLAGECYLILVDRSLGGGNFQITFGGTAVLNCTPTFCSPASLTEPGTIRNISVYPNPSGNTVNLELPVAGCRVKILDVMGKPVLERMMYSVHETLPLNFPSGIYYLQVEQGDEYFSTTIIKE